MKQDLTLKLAQLDYLQNLQLNKLSYLVENSVSKSQNNSFYRKNKYELARCRYNIICTT